MKLTWKKKGSKRPFAAVSKYPNLPFDLRNEDGEVVDTELKENDERIQDQPKTLASHEPSDPKQLAQSFHDQGNKLAEDGKFGEALGKWEAALMLMPEIAILNEQKAQVLLEMGDSWKALKAAIRATELEPSWADAWVTLGRAQLNFGEPDSAIESFDRALAIKPDSQEVRDDRQTALHLVKRRKQLHSSGLSTAENRYTVGDQTGSS